MRPKGLWASNLAKLRYRATAKKIQICKKKWLWELPSWPKIQIWDKNWLLCPPQTLESVIHQPTELSKPSSRQRQSDLWVLFTLEPCYCVPGWGNGTCIAHLPGDFDGGDGTLQEPERPATAQLGVILVSRWKKLPPGQQEESRSSSGYWDLSHLVFWTPRRNICSEGWINRPH